MPEVISVTLIPMPRPLSDVEVLSMFMGWAIRLFTLDTLYEIECRLTPVQWVLYHQIVVEQSTQYLPVDLFHKACHLTADEKVAALVTVLRPVVEASR